MDIHDLWQQHKRWILGVALGFLVYWIGSQIIESMHDTAGKRSAIANVVLNVSRSDFYSREALQNLKQERELLRAEEARLRAALEYQPADEFRLEGKGAPDLHFHQVSRRVRRAVRDAADRAGVELLDKDLKWPTPVEREAIQDTLIGLGLLEDAMRRLIAVHEKVLVEQPDALGVRSIDNFEVVGKIRLGRRTRGRGRGQDPGEEIGIDEQSVDFAFRADARTVEAFLEACRGEGQPLVLDPGFTIKVVGKQAGEPVLVQGRLSAITFRDEAEVREDA